MAKSGRHMRLFAGRSLAAVLVSTAILVAGVSAQSPGWQAFAEREAQRAAEARRAELIQQQYERRRSAAHARMRVEDDTSLYASTLNATDSQLSCPALPVTDTPSVFDRFVSTDANGTLLINIGDGDSTGTAPQAAGTALPWWPDRLSPVLQGPDPDWDFGAAHADLLPSSEMEARSAAVPETTHAIPLFPSASDAHGRQGIAQIRNRSTRSGEVRIVAVDDSGREYGPLSLFVEANGTVQFDSDDLESGNPDTGLYGGTGPGVGHWRLELSSDVEFEALSFVRTWDGVLAPMHDTVASEGNRHRVPIFHPASQWEQESRLRLINPGGAQVMVTIAGIDSLGNSPGTGISLTIPSRSSVTYTAAELESGNGPGLRGSLGDGSGEWRLMVDSAQPLHVMNLVSSPTGHLSNLSTVPSNDTQGVHGVPLMPVASDPSGRLGLVRVINRTDTAGNVFIEAFDDTHWNYTPLVLSLDARQTAQFDSNDLEQGNLGRGLASGTGPGEGAWRLKLTSELDIEVLSYMRAWDGLLTPMHDVALREGTQYGVSTFGTQSDPEHEGRLRLINPGSTPAEVTISGADSFDTSLGGGVSVSIPAGASRTYTAAELASGDGPGLAGSLGDTTAGRQLLVESEQPLQVMSLLSGPAGRLTNLSSGPVRGVPVPPPFIGMDSDSNGTETIEEVFGSQVSPIVQAKCVLCHVQGGVSGTTRLVFVPATNADHEALNLQVFRNFLEEVDDAADLILNKVQGVAHGGGVQAAAGTDDFTNLQRFLGLVGEAISSISITPETLFDGVTMETPRQTLRRAALVFAGRIPTDVEYAAIQGGDEETLRTTIRGLMTGPGFHEFLVRASNDRLLTDRDRVVIDAAATEDFVDFSNLYHSMATSGISFDELWWWYLEVQYGIARSPLELIAHVASNELPYTEILTADYIMANPLAAKAYGASTEFDDPTDLHEFRPSEIVSYYRDDESKVSEYSLEFGTNVIDPGNLATEYPHAGILNTTVFLKRYPTTATNRNRARSRWTYYHFLGLDIEKSASRTTDPVALADTNNPTMNNPACTVCHTVMDPVAGAFQNYGDEGLYRDQWGGLDSLDAQYKEGLPPATIVEVTSRSPDEKDTVSVTASLEAGNHTFALATRSSHNIHVDYLTVRNATGEQVLRQELEALGQEDCGSTWTGDTFELIHCPLLISVDLPNDGEYEIKIAVYVGYDYDEIPGRPAKLAIWVNYDLAYQEGDTWYRDMRAPGFDGQLAPNADNSLQWLAQRIVADDRFAEAAVKFWWPAVMGAEVAEPPEDETDAGFEGLLLASNAQVAEVGRLANGFRSGFRESAPYNLKDLLVEIVLSPWFRAQAMTGEDTVRTIALAGVGARRLLTPEELARKTLAVTGFQWGRVRGRSALDQGISQLTDIERGYGLLYGGIDSDGITERSRDLTSVMAGVAQSHALHSSYPIVMREFYLLPETDRLLFSGIGKLHSPITEFGDTFEIEAAARSELQTLPLEGRLTAGRINISLAFLNDFGDDEGSRDVLLDRIDVRRGTELIYQFEMEEHEHIDCNHYEQDAFHLSGSDSHCVLNVPVDIPSDGTYIIETLAWADQYGDELAKLRVAVESDSLRSTGANAIRAVLVGLFDKLHGIQVTADSEEVRGAYDLFVEIWERKNGAYGDHFMWNDENIAIDWASDQRFLDDIADDMWREELDENDWPLGWDWDRIEEFFETVDWSDPQAVARTWAVVLAYLMMDYRYLYL